MSHIRPRDWTEDFDHENGNYMCRCCVCERIFYGHKRRQTCKVCSTSLEQGQAVIGLKELEALIEHWFDVKNLGTEVTVKSLLYFSRDISMRSSQYLIRSLKMAEDEAAALRKQVSELKGESIAG